MMHPSMQHPGKPKPSVVLLLILLALPVWVLIFGPPAPAFFSFGSLGPLWLLLYAIVCAAAGWFPPTAGPLDRFLSRVKSSPRRLRPVAGVAVGGIAGLYLLCTAWTEHRQLFPYIHDEFSYLIQAHQFAAGCLWMPAHPLAEFFDSFQLLVTPVYASAYFPGTALLYVPGAWLHLPPFVTALTVAATVAGLLFWITAELIDPAAAALAVLLLLSDGVYRQASVLVLGQLPLLLYGLLAITVWLKWRKRPRLIWLPFCGLFLGLAAVTRPVDAICFAIPIGIAVLLRGPRQLTFLILGALPLLVFQMILNHGITGHWLQTPFGLYAQRDYPGTSYGFHTLDPSARPLSSLPQKQALYHEYLPLLIEHRPANILRDLLQSHGPFAGARLRLTLSQYSPVPFPMLTLLLPLALLRLTKPRVVLLSLLPLFVILYVPYVFFFPHYVLTAAPAVIVAIVSGAGVLWTAWPAHRRWIEITLTLFIAGTSIAALPQWSGTDEDVFQAGLLASVNQQLANLPHLPAVVLFTYDPQRNTHEEPVYNPDVAWPDDVPILRAHDLGPKNQTLFNYYAKHQPDRYIYRFNEKNRTLQLLGKAIDLTKTRDKP